MKDIVKIIKYSWSLKRFYIPIAVMVVLTSLLGQVPPFVTKFLVDNVVKLGTGHYVAPVSFVILFIILIGSQVAISLISNFQGYLGDLLSVKLTSLLSKRYFEHLLKLPLEFYDNEITGKITARLERSIVSIGELVKSMANTFIAFILTSFISLVILARYSPLVAILLAVLFPLYIWLTSLSSKSWQKVQDQINRDTDLANGRFIESIGQIRVVKSFAQEVAELRFFGGKRQNIENYTSSQSKRWHMFDVYRRLSLNVVFFFIYLIIIIQALHGHFGPIQTSVGTLFLMIQLATQAQMPLFGSSFIVESLQKAVSDSKDFFSIMEIEPKIKDQPGAGKLTVKSGRIEYKEVDFAYNEGQPVLTDISFEIAPGSKLALVGESGQGKTTIANLLLRFYETTGGEILIDGQNVKDVSQESLRRNIAVVFQEPALFSGTVAQNIGYGQAKVSQNDLIEAAKAANAYDFINKLPQGFETEIGERGVKLSGGQKQRIAIARAVLKNAPILILDEATSSLDSRAEREVQDALDRLMHNRTTLIIAHRLSTIASVDTIVTLTGGQVDEIGSPAELAKTEGIYAQLLELQAPTKANKAKLRKYDIAKA